MTEPTAAELADHRRLEPWFRYACNWPDPDRCELIWLLAHTMLALQEACLVGNPAPSVQRMLDRMNNPQPGDVVLEVSSVWRPNWPERALGRLVSREGPNNYRGTMVVASLYFWDHPETDWENARFIALPIDETDFLGKPGRMTITRDSLLGHLTDSGFQLKT